MALLERLHSHVKYLDEQIADIEKELGRQLQDDGLGQRLMSIPGVGPITASVLAAEVGDGKQYRCGRDCAASIGLVPRQYGTGGKNKAYLVLRLLKLDDVNGTGATLIVGRSMPPGRRRIELSKPHHHRKSGLQKGG